jgi:predicted DNA-binding transcriptional regulator YafY
VLTDAALRRRPVRFRYYGIGRDEISRREVEPYGIGWHERHWYVVGRDRGREGVRQFRVDRIRGRARMLTGPAFEVPEDFDVSDHVGRPAFLLRRDGRGERVLREGWTFRDLADGGGLLEFDANDRAAVIRFVARHAERARVVAPESLRREAVQYFRGILAAHDDPPGAGGAKSARRRGGAGP